MHVGGGVVAPIVDGLDYPGRVDIPEGDVRVNGLLFWPGTRPNRRIFLYSGVALFDWKGVGGSWTRAVARIHIPLQGVQWKTVVSEAGPKTPTLSNSAATVSCAAISNEGVANNAGWAADWTSVETDAARDGGLVVVAGIAVNDSDGHIWRLAYQMHALGTI
jgi:hypothetical protein